MIWSSRAGKLGVGLASVGLHGFAALMLWGAPDIRIEGGAEGAVQAQLGNSFADMVAGTLDPENPDTLEAVEPDDPVELIAPETPIEQTDAQDVTEVTKPEAVHAQEIDAEAPTEALVAPDLPTEATPPATALALAPPVTNPSRADLAAPLPVTPLEPTPQPTITAEAPPPETLEALPEDGVQVSRRPTLRPKRIEQEAEQQQPTRRVQQGNAQENAVAGSETGSNQAAASPQSTKTGQAAAAGNAAASNYPGRVMRCISRVGRPRVSTRGKALVAFSVAANGRVDDVRLARSSGDARLDRAALQIISRAGPCPAPPKGARRSYQISIKGRG
ncbi:MAG: TonB family protein [Pseudomonadota bacterium]